MPDVFLGTIDGFAYLGSRVKVPVDSLTNFIRLYLFAGSFNDTDLYLALFEQ